MSSSVYGWHCEVNVPNEWVVLELSPKADGEDPDLIRASIRHMIRDADVFIPVSVSKVGDDRIIKYLVDGYAFIRRAHPDDKYFKLEGSRYVQTIITKANRLGSRMSRELACATDADIDRFKSQIHVAEDQGIGVGDTVMVMSGPYRQIQAVVIEEIPEDDTVQIHVKFRSKESIVTLPRSFLRLVEKAPHVNFRPRARALREWLTKIAPVAAFDERRITTIQDRFRVFEQYNRWLAKGQALHEGIRAAQSPSMDARPLASKLVHLHRLHAWRKRGEHLIGVVRLVGQPLDASFLLAQCATFNRLYDLDTRLKRLVPLFVSSASAEEVLERLYLRWNWLSDASRRLEVIESDVCRIERKVLGVPFMPHNLIIDGHNLAIRCATVPGLDALVDSRGRPTGAIVGFLRSLGAFFKRFPGVTTTVTWDGSSQRRRKMYAGYKANRGALRTYFEIEYLQGLLPSLGIQQVWNPEEEADDVIATLVRGAYKDQQNVILSTDRDLLQLVSDNTQVFVPAVGAGKEKAYDIDAVEKDYGVRPDRMVHLRAIEGDTSDNIPGAPGFGAKTASKLLRLYGTVDQLFASNLAGLTAMQYQKLRGAETQVKLNVQLMTLHDDLPLTTVAPRPEQSTASQQLLDINVKVDTILPLFFPTAAAV